MTSEEQSDTVEKAFARFTASGTNFALAATPCAYASMCACSQARGNTARSTCSSNKRNPVISFQ